jgi:hypothetical protein
VVHDVTLASEKGIAVRTIEHWIAGKPSSGTSERTAPVLGRASGEQQAEVTLAKHVHGAEGISFHTPATVVTARGQQRTDVEAGYWGASFQFARAS